jgi:hypothetical protein
VRSGSLVLAIVVAPGAHAHADVPLDVSADDLVVRDSPSLFHDPGEPLLELDVVPRPHVVGLGITEDTHRTALQLGPRAKITFSGSSWQGYADAVPRDGAENEIARGSRATVGFHYDFGWLQLDATISQNAISSHYGSGSYRDVELRLSKTKRFSRWVSVWIGLSLGRRVWDGTPPLGEQSSTHIMLSVGGTFR